MHASTLPAAKNEALARMKQRLERGLGHPGVRDKIESDFAYTFRQLGLDEAAAQALRSEVIAALSGQDPLDRIEARILERFEHIYLPGADGKHLVGVLHEKLAGRAGIIAAQVRPYLLGVRGRVFDYGTGDGQVAQRLHDDPALRLDIEGGDVRYYKAPDVTITVRQFDGCRVDVPDGAYEAALATNVAHHEQNNQAILVELTRIVSRRLVMIETVPTGANPREIEDDAERTFANDYLYNRLFHNADVPVPGTYETPAGWVARITRLGWRLVDAENLGYDQPTIRDVHHLLVFDRV